APEVGDGLERGLFGRAARRCAPPPAGLPAPHGKSARAARRLAARTRILARRYQVVLDDSGSAAGLAGALQRNRIAPRLGVAPANEGAAGRRGARCLSAELGPVLAARHERSP